MKISYKNMPSIALCILIVLLLLVNAARYIFKFGSSSSPGYSDTPVLFWIIRYALLLGLLGLVASGLARRRPLYWLTYGGLLASVTYSTFFSEGLTIQEEQLIRIAAFYTSIYGLLFVLARSNDRLYNDIHIRHLVKTLWGLAIFAGLFLLLQIGLYISFDILPSHSFKNSTLVRFGSFLDDSLAFGVLLPMFASLCFHGIREDTKKTIALIVVCLVSVLTGSLTAMATTALYSIWLFRKRLTLAVAWGGMLALLAFCFRWQFQRLWQEKTGSIAGHVKGLSTLTGQATNQALPVSVGGFAESGWILLYVNFGVAAVLVLLLFHGAIFMACRRLLLSTNRPLSIPLVGATDGLNFSAVVAMLNLPVIMIFPVYMLLALFGAIVLSLAERNNDMES